MSVRCCLTVLALVLLVAPVGAQTSRDVSETRLKEILEAARKKHDLPALGAAVVRASGPVRVAVVGVRKRGETDPVRVDDAFHLGSETKAMTAWVIGQLVEEGKLSYDLTVDKAFPSLAKSMHEDFRKVTLTQLLSHHAGLPANLPLFGEWFISRKLPIREQRLEGVKRALKPAPEQAPGSRFAYSNLGYLIAGAMAEQAAAESWEDLLQKRLFQPLKMKTAGFGAASADNKEQPWPHRENGKPAAPDADNAPVMGPGGRVHCSLGDWSRFIADELAGGSGKGGLLKKETYQKLFSAPYTDRAYTLGGWGSGRSKPGDRVLTHAGSNTMNVATAIVQLDRNLAVLVVTNQGGDAAEAACAEVRKDLLALLK
jgi:CubicO group peptidase (beta-lactamase class C family)